jgi:PPK2 family polyphosphate:nucleotide phosphotransferase
MAITFQDALEYVRVPPGKKVRLKDYDSSWAGDKKLPKKERKQFAEKILSQDVSALAAAQDLLYAADTYAVLVILQAMDAAGKDGIIKHVMSGLNPQGCQVFSFKQPSAEELDHDFLWRCTKALPERGRIGIFNRSYYEEVLVVKVHPEWIARQRIPDVKINNGFWEDRYESINNFERHLVRNGTVILKFFLNVSKEEQRRRLMERIEEKAKQWKVSVMDVAERDHWDEYMEAYEDMLNATSTKSAPWHVIPADHKWVSRAFVANILSTTVAKLDLRYPQLTPEKVRDIEEARKKLEKD